MERKAPNEINNNTRDIIKTFSIQGKHRIIGSSSLRAIQYGSDYDVVTESDLMPDKIVKLFQTAYKKAGNNPNYWITDFKVGHDERLVYNGDYSKDSVEKYLKNPLISKAKADAIRKADGEKEIELIRDLYILRWKPQDVERGWIKMIDGKPKFLKDAIMDKTTMKIDLLGLVGDRFIELSENYTVKNKEGTNEVKETPAEIEAKFEDEIQYYSRKDSFKALKRLFSLLQREKGSKNKAKLDKLVEFFNGQVGFLNKIKNELNILEMVLTQDYRCVKWEDVYNNLQFIKERISQIYEIPVKSGVFKDIDDMTKKNVLEGVRKLKDYFVKLINERSKKFLGDIL